MLTALPQQCPLSSLIGCYQAALTGRSLGAVNRWFTAHGATPLDGPLKTSVLDSLRKSGGLPKERSSLLGSLLNSDESTTADLIFDFLTSHAAVAGLLSRKRHTYRPGSSSCSPAGERPLIAVVRSPSAGNLIMSFEEAAGGEACEVQ